MEGEPLMAGIVGKSWFKQTELDESLHYWVGLHSSQNDLGIIMMAEQFDEERHPGINQIEQIVPKI